MTETKYYPAQPAPTPTPILTRYAPGTNSISLESTDYVPAPPNRITLYDSSGIVVTLAYSGLINNTLTGLDYVEGDSKREYEVGDAYAIRTINAEDINSLQTGKLDKYQGTANAGKVMRVDDEGNLYPSDGVGDYDELENKPQISSVTLEGNKTPNELGIASLVDLARKQNKVYYQNETPTDAVPGDLWCTDGVETTSFANITGNPDDNALLKAEFDNKIDKSPTSPTLIIGEDSSGLYYNT